MNTAMLSHDVRFPIAPFGTRLGTRGEGAAAQALLLRALRALPEPGRLIVDLHSVDVLSGSFADEAIAIPCARLAAGEFGNRYLLVETPHHDLTDDLGYKLERRRLAMLCLSDGAWTVLGPLPLPMMETLTLIIERGQTTAKELAMALDIRHNACLHRVGRLADLRLIHREETGSAGPYASYELFSTLSESG
jgi:hypothetical protein